MSYYKEQIKKQLSPDFLEKLNSPDYFVFSHTGDTHNGYSGNASRYNEYQSLRIEKTNERGINVRQADVDAAFEQVIEFSAELAVDAVLHGGDGWDAPGYKERSVDNFYTKQVTKLREKGIEYVEIVGNHNLPKKAGKGCFLESLGRYPLVQTVYKGVYEQISIDNGNVVVHCVPSSFNQEILNESLDAIEKVPDKINLGLGHFGVTSIPYYAEASENTLVTTLDTLISKDLDYFALSDYHKETTFTDRIRYCGASERFGFGELHNKPQFLVVAIHKETREIFAEPIKLKVRKMFELDQIDAETFSIEHINELIKMRLTSKDLTDAIVRLRIVKLPVHLKEFIDTEMIQELTKDALYFKLEFKEKTEVAETTNISFDVEFESIIDGWKNFAANLPDDGSFDKDEVERIGHEKLQEALDKKA